MSNILADLTEWAIEVANPADLKNFAPADTYYKGHKLLEKALTNTNKNVQQINGKPVFYKAKTVAKAKQLIKIHEKIVELRNKHICLVKEVTEKSYLLPSGDSGDETKKYLSIDEKAKKLGIIPEDAVDKHWDSLEPEDYYEFPREELKEIFRNEPEELSLIHI